MKHHPPLDRLHQHTQTKRTAKRTAHAPTLSEPSTGATADRDLNRSARHWYTDTNAQAQVLGCSGKHVYESHAL